MRSKKYVVYAIVMIMIVSLGVSYSYFVSNNSMTQKEIKITSKDISIVLTDNMEIVNTTITPGWSTSKTFTVKNNSEEIFNYNLIIKDLINTFVTEGYLQYKITSENGYNMTEYVDIPKSETAKDTTLVYDIDINPSVLQEYTIEFVYHDSEEDQSIDMGKVFGGTLAIVEGTIDPNKYYTVTLEVENGTIPNGNSKESLKNGNVTFEVEPDTGYELSGSVECEGSASGSISENTITISGIKENQTCRVNTSKKTYTLSIGTNDVNMGTVSPSSPVIEHGSDATITITPKDGYKYSSNDCGGTVSGNTMTIKNVTSSKTCTVIFEISKSGYYYVMLSDGYTYAYNNTGALISKTLHNGQFTVEYTGDYTLELHGGGGGGGGGVNNEIDGETDFNYGSGGGGSGQIYDISLTGGETYNISIGLGGQGGTEAGTDSTYGYKNTTGGDGQRGGTTIFGSYSLAGGAGGMGYNYYASMVGGAASGSLATAGLRRTSYQKPYGGQGGSTIGGNYGNGAEGGRGCDKNPWSSGFIASSASSGYPGAIILRKK